MIENLLGADSFCRLLALVTLCRILIIASFSAKVSTCGKFFVGFVSPNYKNCHGIQNAVC